jgi:hypothetical protein
LETEGQIKLEQKHLNSSLLFQRLGNGRADKARAETFELFFTVSKTPRK